VKRLNPVWVDQVKSKINNKETIDLVIKEHSVAQWLVVQLAQNNVPFKVYSLGAGVKRITTETDVCPCCKNNLQKDS
jgi:hypothetical protein